jgi:hypothetical protein
MIPDPKEFAAEWIDAWNSHDLERILCHYADNVEVTTPMIKVAMGIDDGTVYGKDAARQYWGIALQKFPDLYFELVKTALSVTSIALYYKSVMGKMAIETMFFNEDGKVNKVVAHYD